MLSQMAVFHLFYGWVVFLFFIYTYHFFFIQPSIKGHFSCVHVLATVSNAEINIGVHISLQIHFFFSFFGGYPGERLLSHMVTLFLFFRTCQTVFQSDCTSLHSHHQQKRVCFSPQPLHLLLLDLFITAILTGVRWYLMVVLICISLIANEIEHLFIYLFTICRSSGERCLFRSSAHFQLDCLFVWC